MNVYNVSDNHNNYVTIITDTIRHAIDMYTKVYNVDPEQINLERAQDRIHVDWDAFERENELRKLKNDVPGQQQEVTLDETVRVGLQRQCRPNNPRLR